MKASHFCTPRQLDDATFYNPQTSWPAGVAPERVSLGERLVSIVAGLCIVGVLLAVAAGVI